MGQLHSRIASRGRRQNIPTLNLAIDASGSSSLSPNEVMMLELESICETMHKRGIFKSCHNFVKSTLLGENKATINQLNEWITTVIKEEIGDENSQLPIDPIGVISNVISLLHARKLQKLITLLSPFAEMALDCGVDRKKMLSMYKNIVLIFPQTYGARFPIGLQFCCDAVALLLISTMIYLQKRSLCLSSGGSSPVSSIDTDDSKIDLSASAIPVGYSYSEFKEIYDSPLLGLSDLLSISFTKSSADMLAHPFGGTYLCRYIEQECNRNEILTIWRSYLKVRFGIADKSQQKKLSSLVVDVYLTGPIREQGILSLSTCRKVKTEYKSTGNVLFGLLYQDTLQWIDNYHMAHIKKLLSTNHDYKSLQNAF